MNNFQLVPISKPLVRVAVCKYEDGEVKTFVTPVLAIAAWQEGVSDAVTLDYVVHDENQDKPVLRSVDEATSAKACYQVVLDDTAAIRNAVGSMSDWLASKGE